MCIVNIIVIKKSYSELNCIWNFVSFRLTQNFNYIVIFLNRKYTRKIILNYTLIKKKRKKKALRKSKFSPSFSQVIVFILTWKIVCGVDISIWFIHCDKQTRFQILGKFIKIKIILREYALSSIWNWNLVINLKLEKLIFNFFHKFFFCLEIEIFDFKSI